MGDYLGATICITEVILLTAILLFSHSASFLQYMEGVGLMALSAKHGKVSISDVIDHILKEDRAVALVQFIAIVGFTAIWCSCVGHPPVFVRESVVATIDTADEIRIRLTTDNQQNDNIGINGNRSNNKSSGRISVEQVCQDPHSSFNQRYDAVLAYLDSLAKPVGSLGTLEDWAARLAAIQRTSTPSADNVACIIFAADHGVAADEKDGGSSCSAYPQSVTRKILEAFEAGVAGGSVLSRKHGASLCVVDVGLTGADFSGGVVTTSSHKIRGGTKNFCVEPAMSTEQVERCIVAGRTAVSQCLENTGAKVLVFGEVGIGNTTSSSAVLAALTGTAAETLCDGGATMSHTVDESLIAKKVSIVKKALELHGIAINRPMMALAKYGGAEIASMVGAILQASERNVAVLVDGFIVSTAATVAAHISPGVCKVLFFASRSSERGQQVAIGTIQQIAQEHDVPEPPNPALSMGLRLGEGTGALMVIPILRSAAAVLSELATLDEVLELGSQPT